MTGKVRSSLAFALTMAFGFASIGEAAAAPKGKGASKQSLQQLADDPEACPDGSFLRLDPDGTGLWQCLGLADMLMALGLSNLVFVTSTTHTGNLVEEASDPFEFDPPYAGTDGLEAGDFICNYRAGVAGLPGSYVAWLSSESTHAIDRLPAGSGPYVRSDGVVVADDRADLVDGSLDENIPFTEFGTRTTGLAAAWTGTDESGQATPGNTCQGWTIGAGGGNGTFGAFVATDFRWTTNSIEQCGSTAPLRLYCFQK